MTSPSSAPSTPGSGRDEAYRLGARMAKDRIAREAPLDAAALEALEASDIVVVSGIYDRVAAGPRRARDAVHRGGAPSAGSRSRSAPSSSSS